MEWWWCFNHFFSPLMVDSHSHRTIALWIQNSLQINMYDMNFMKHSELSTIRTESIQLKFDSWDYNSTADLIFPFFTKHFSPAFKISTLWLNVIDSTQILIISQYITGSLEKINKIIIIWSSFFSHPSQSQLQEHQLYIVDVLCTCVTPKDVTSI